MSVRWTPIPPALWYQLNVALHMYHLSASAESGVTLPTFFF